MGTLCLPLIYLMGHREHQIRTDTTLDLTHPLSRDSEGELHANELGGIHNKPSGSSSVCLTSRGLLESSARTRWWAEIDAY